MKKILLFNLILSILFVQNNYAQDHTRRSLPDGAIARLSKGWILDIAYSDDGTRLAVGSSIGVWIYNTLHLVEMAVYSPVGVWMARFYCGICRSISHLKPLLPTLMAMGRLVLATFCFL